MSWQIYSLSGSSGLIQTSFFVLSFVSAARITHVSHLVDVVLFEYSQLVFWLETMNQSFRLLCNSCLPVFQGLLNYVERFIVSRNEQTVLTVNFRAICCSCRFEKNSSSFETIGVVVLLLL